MESFDDQIWQSSSKYEAAVLRMFYKDLTGDSTAASNNHEAEIDERVRLLLEMEDPDILLDMRALNTNNRSQYVFCYKCQKCLESQ